MPNWTPDNNSPQSTLHPDPEWSGHLERKPFPGCLTTMETILEMGFEPIGVVSRITMLPLIEAKIRKWFTHHGFDKVIPQSLIRFCATWEEKVGFCLARGTTHFIDNRLKPLAPMVGKVPHLYLFQPPGSKLKDDHLLHLVQDGSIISVRSWAEFGQKVFLTTK